MIVFCAFEQMQLVIDEGKKHGLNHAYPLVFIKNFSAQVLKANMKIVGASEHAKLYTFLTALSTHFTAVPLNFLKLAGLQWNYLK